MAIIYNNFLGVETITITSNSLDAAWLGYNLNYTDDEGLINTVKSCLEQAGVGSLGEGRPEGVLRRFSLLFPELVKANRLELAAIVLKGRIKVYKKLKEKGENIEQLDLLILQDIGTGLQLNVDEDIKKEFSELLQSVDVQSSDSPL